MFTEKQVAAEKKIYVYLEDKAFNAPFINDLEPYGTIDFQDFLVVPYVFFNGEKKVYKALIVNKEGVIKKIKLNIKNFQELLENKEKFLKGGK